MKLSKQETEIEMSDDKVYKVSNNSGELGDIEFSPGLPNDLLIQDLLNNKKIVLAHPNVVQKVLNMEWAWFERRVIKWLGDSPESRELQKRLRTHIKNEKKWIKRGAKADEVRLFQ
jgi:hypothetical protein